MRWEIPAEKIADYYDERMEQYKAEVQNLRQLTEGVESFATAYELLNPLLQNLLLMLSEDNIVTTQVTLQSYTTISGKTKTFREFIDSQRFIIKIMFDFYNKSY